MRLSTIGTDTVLLIADDVLSHHHHRKHCPKMTKRKKQTNRKQLNPNNHVNPLLQRQKCCSEACFGFHMHYYMYYMASSASGQDEPNRALWLATQTGKMEPSCLLGTTRCILHEKFPRKPYNKSFIDQVCSVKMVGYWPRSVFASLWTSTSSRSIPAQKKELGQYPAILTSHLVNNPYIVTGKHTQLQHNQLRLYTTWMKHWWTFGLK